MVVCERRKKKKEATLCYFVTGVGLLIPDRNSIHPDSGHSDGESGPVIGRFTAPPARFVLAHLQWGICFRSKYGGTFQRCCYRSYEFTCSSILVLLN